MSETAIKVEGLGKRYRLGGESSSGMFKYRSIRDSLASAAMAPFRRSNHAAKAVDQEFWALKDVSFEVKRGEVVGIIGRNGAGKSTLLKILSRITDPTAGEIEITGRVGSLLEVGTGFHPELTGRENIYLNGSILGMKRWEIDQKFDEIVAFAETEKFLDTPVKFYSSGMYTRLAFAVAAHLEPEILVVDEVLAVGDAAFQKKCMGKMSDVASHGRTVLFVSHNMAAIKKLCTHAAVLNAGQLAFIGDTENAVLAYARQTATGPGVLTAGPVSVQISTEDPLTGQLTELWRDATELLVRIRVRSQEHLSEPAVDLSFYTESGIRLLSFQSDRISDVMRNHTGREFNFEFRIRNVGLAGQELSLDVGVRASKSTVYLGCWRGVQMIGVTLDEKKRGTVADSLIVPPLQFSAEVVA